MATASAPVFAALMRLRDRRLPTALVPVFVAVAILGYVAGHSRAQGGAAAEKLRTAAGAHVVLDYPAGWRPATKAPGIPGLPIANPILLAPNGDAAHAGLLAGTLPRSQLSPLPGKFVASMRGLPETEVVDLLEIQAYRYERLKIPGFDRTLSLFVIPNPHGDPTALACYASAALSASMRTCEGIVATVTLVAQTHVPDHVYEEAKKHFTEQEIVDLTYLAATINAWNRLAIALRALPGHYRATKTTA